MLTFVQPPRDAEILQAIERELTAHAASGQEVTLIETAGGVLSPALSGVSQADFYRPLRLPVLLVADHKLGGIGVSISAYESLRLRGYDVDSVIIFKDDVYENYAYLQDYFKGTETQSCVIDPPPARRTSQGEDEKLMLEYYEQSSQSQEIRELLDTLSSRHETRLKNLESMAKRSDALFLYLNV